MSAMAEGDEGTNDQGRARADLPPPTSDPSPLVAEGPVIFVRQPGGATSRVAVRSLAEGPLRLRATTEVALREKGPFEPLAYGIAADSELRARLADGLALPASVAFAKLRPLLFLGLVPLFMLVELDRELLVAGLPGARFRLVAGALFGVLLAVDFARRVPRHPGTSAAVLFWVAARYANVLAVVCGKTGVHGFFAPVLAAAIGVLLLSRAPRGNRLTEAIADKLAIDPGEILRVRLGEMPTPNVVGATVLAAFGLPVMLFVLRKVDGNIWTSGIALVAYSAIVPELVERFVERARPPAGRFRKGRLLFATVVGFALTTGLVSAAQRTFDAGIYLQRCTHPAEFEREGKKLLEAEAHEVKRGITQAKDALPVLLMTVLAVPLAEERLYRGLLQRVLTRRYGERLGLVYAALAFGASHLVVYKVAAYQAALLGFGFGSAFAEGGLVASFLAHAIWNAHLLV